MRASLNKEVFRLALPSILANITIPLVGIVDTAIAGHTPQTAAIGGIAIGSMLFDLLYWNFGFLRVGTAGLTAQAYGKEQADKNIHVDAARILVQSVGVALAASLLILLLQWVFLRVSMALIPCSQEVSDFATTYFYIRIWAAPATLSLMVFRGWFIGMQNTMATMLIDLVVNVSNMLFSWLLAIYTPLGAMGVAYGTLIAQYLGLATALFLLLFKYDNRVRLIADKAVIRAAFQRENIKRMFVLNGNLFVRSLCFLVIYVGFTSIASKYGDTELAVSSIMMKLFMLFSYLIDGFAYAGEALTGRFVGEANPQELHRTVRILFLWTLLVGGACALIYGVFAEPLVSLMTNHQEIILASRPYFIWLVLMPIISCLAFLWDGVFIGLTAGDKLRNAMILAALSFVIFYVALQPFCGIQALYIAYFAHLLARTIYLTIVWIGIKAK